MGVRSLGVAAGVAVGVLVPLLVAGTVAFVVAERSPLDSAAEPAPLVGTIDSAQRTDQTNVALSVELADARGPSLRASGTLTGLFVAPGDAVASGQVVARVDAGDVLAYTSDAPLYRDIARGLEGSDVATAQALLTAWGYAAGTADGKAGVATERAIKAFNVDHGFGKNNPVLSLAALTWIGPEPVSVGEVKVHAGDEVSSGAELFTTSASLARITVTEGPGVPQDAELVLVVADVTVPYIAGSGAVSTPEDVVLVAGALSASGEGVGTIQRATPITVATVPAGAVVSDPAGATCVFPSVDGAPVPVTPLGGSLGTIDLDASLAGQPVLFNPRDVRQDLSCG